MGYIAKAKSSENYCNGSVVLQVNRRSFPSLSRDNCESGIEFSLEGRLDDYKYYFASLVSDAGDDFFSPPSSSANLDGSGSSTEDVTYAWSLTSKPGGSSLNLGSSSITNSDQITASFTPDVAGQYVFTLTVDDGDTSEIDTLIVTANTLPVANAGTAPTDYRPTEQFSLDGSSSSDADSDSLTYVWTLTSKPGGSSKTTSDIVDATTVSPDFTADVIGDYEFSLIVNDGKQNSASADTVTVTVVANQLPTISAGTDGTGNVSSLVSTNGSITVADPEGDALTYAWTFVSVPDGSALVDGNISDSTTLTADFTPDVAGSYTLRFTVTDTFDGQTVTDDVIFTVTDGPPSQSTLQQWLLDSGQADSARYSSGALNGYVRDLSTDGTERLPVVGAALDFDNVNDFINFGSIAALQSASTFTIEGFFNADTLSASGDFVLSMRSGADTDRIEFIIYSTQCYAIVCNGSSSSFNTYAALSASTNYHFAIVFDGTETGGDRLRLYLNGSLQTPTATGTFPTSTSATAHDLYVGIRNGDSRYFDGKMWGWEIHDSALTADNIAYQRTSKLDGVATSGTAPSTKAEHIWHMNHAGGLTAFDSGATGGKHGVITSATWTTQNLFSYPNLVGYTPGKYFAAASGFQIAENSSGPLAAIGTGDFTVGLWVYVEGGDSFKEFIYNWNTTGLIFGIDNTGKMHGYVGSATSNVASINYTFPLNTWVHVVLERSSGTVQAYVNGATQGSSYTASGSLSAVRQTWIGRDHAGAEDMQGYIHDLRIYNTAIGSSNIAGWYAGTYTGSPVSRYCHDGTIVDGGSGGWDGYNATGLSDVLYPRNEAVTTETIIPDVALTYSGRTPYPGKLSDGCLTLDGANDYAGFGNLGISGDAAITLAAWVNIDTFGAYETVIFIGNSGSALQAISLIVHTGGAFGIACAGANNVISNTGLLTAGEWAHIAVTKSAGALNTTTKFYLNGNEVSNDGSPSTGTPNITEVGNNRIGAFGAAGSYLDGKVCGVVRKASAMSAGDIATLALGQAVTGLANEWPCNDKSGLVVTDPIGGANGIITGATVAAAWANTQDTAYQHSTDYGVDLVRYFDGVDDYASMGANSALQSASAFTIAGWVVPGNATALQSLFSHRNGADTDRVEIYKFSSTQVLVAVTNTANAYHIYNRLGSSDLGQLLHVAVVFDGTQGTNADRVKLYIDGTLQTPAASAGTFPSSTSASTPNFILGKRDTAAGYFAGLQSEWNIFSSALSQDNITYLSSLGTSGTNPGTSYGHWKLDDTGSTAVDSGSGGNDGTYTGTSIVTLPTNAGTSLIRSAPSNPAGKLQVYGTTIDLTGGVTSPMSSANSWDTSHSVGDTATNPEYVRNSTSPDQDDRFLAYESALSGSNDTDATTYTT